MRLALALVALVFPASAAAAPFGELPFRPVAGSATCLRATGVPGELVRWTRGGVGPPIAKPPLWPARARQAAIGGATAWCCGTRRASVTCT